MTGKMTIGFAGLSHLGIVYSMAAVARGFSVVAFDGCSELIARLTVGDFPINEPGLEEHFRTHRDRICYTDDVSRLAGCSLIFFALDVQTDESNNSNLEPLKSLIQCVAASVGDAVLVVMSQVPPGFCRKLANELPPELGLYYQVETLVFGNAIERALRPERYMVGGADPANPLPEIYRRFLDAFECPVLPMRYESAELCKIAINCFLVSSVSTTNMLAELCEKTQADWSEIVPALRLDRRIGPHAYLNAGLGIAGGNLERDLVTVQRLAAERGTDSRVVTAWQQNSAYSRDWVLRRLSFLGLLADPSGSTLGLWGLAYKQDTHSTKNSPSLALLRDTLSNQWLAYDPVARIDETEFPRVRLCTAALEAARGTSALVVMTPWKEFAAVDLAAVRSVMAGNVILDPYAVLSDSRCREMGFRYHRLGAGELC